MGRPDERDRMVESEAAAWVVRLEAGPLSPEERTAFESWLRESEAHAASFALARETWSELAQLYPAESPMPDAVRPAGVRRPRPVLRRRLLQGLAASLAVAAAVGFAISGGNPLTSLRADYHTLPGERLSVSMPDGSIAELNTDSAISLRFDASRREVEVLAGEVAFTVARMPDRDRRPFTVRAAGGTAKALGTRFVVRRQETGAVVTVLEHRVEVSLADRTGDAPRAVTLRTAQTVRYDTATGLGQVRQVDPDRAAGWLHGRLVFDQVLLEEAVAELNRYRLGRIVIGDPTLAQRPVSGVFRLDDLDAAVDVIAAEFDARRVDVPPLLTVLF